MTAVRTTTEEYPELGLFLAVRRDRGFDTYDEWWEGTYQTVTGPTPESGRLVNKLAILLDPLAEAAGLHTAAPVNIGIDKVDCRVPDLGVYRPDTPRSSPAFLETAELVVDVLSPGERAGAKMPFYLAWDVGELVEIDLERATVGLWRNRDGGWARTTSSGVLQGLEVTDHELLVGSVVGSVVAIRDFQGRPEL